MAEGGKKISFGFAKSIKKPVLKSVAPQEEKKVDYIECLDEKAIKVIGGEEKKDEPLVIPLLGSRTWHDRIVNKIDADIFEPKSTENTVSEVKIKKEPIEAPNGHVSPVGTISTNTPSENDQSKEVTTNENKAVSLEEQAAKEILEDIKSSADKTEEKPLLSLPLADDSALRGVDESTIEDYEKIPVDAFGMAMLRGMGWQPGRGIGKNEKVVAAVVPELRPKGMGLGADKVTLRKQVTDSKAKPEEELKVEKGAYVKIIAGKESNNYGIVEGLDEDAGRLIVKMALKGNIVSVNEFMAQPITKSEYTKNAKVLNATKYEKYQNKGESIKQEESLSESSNEETCSSHEEETKKKDTKEKRSNEKKKSKKPKECSSNSESDREKRSRKRRSSNSSDSYKPKKSKKHKSHNDRTEHLSKKRKKKSKEQERTRNDKHKNSESIDRRKHKNHKRARSRSSSKR